MFPGCEESQLVIEREEEEREGREGGGGGGGGWWNGGWPAGDGNDTSGTSFVHMEAWIPGEPGLWVARSPLSPRGGCFLDAASPPTPKRNSYNSPFVFCRNLELTSCYNAQGKEPRRTLSFPMLPHCRQGKFIWLPQVPARPLQQGLELCSLLGDRQPGPFPLLFQKAPHKPWQQLRRSRRHSQTAGRSKPDDGDTCPLQASQCQA